MATSNPSEDIWPTIIELIEQSELKYRMQNYKGALEDKRKVKALLNNCKTANAHQKYIKIIQAFNVRKFKYDLIQDYKGKIDDLKKSDILNRLIKLSEHKYNCGDYKAAIKALRRAEKYY